MSTQRNHGEGKGRRGQRLADLATDQNGVVSLGQLRSLEVTRRSASRLASAGELQRVHRGVYAVGHRAFGRIGELQAALLACGEGSVISHGTAAAFWGLRDPLPVLIDVTVPCEAGRKIDGVRCRRCRYPTAEEIVVRQGVVCTTPARTMVDNAGMLGIASIRRMVERAAVIKRLDLRALDTAIGHAKRRRGMKALELVLEDWRTEDHSVADVRSDFEALVLPRLLARGLPRPVCNKKLLIDGERFTPDFLWEELRVVVETDGKQSHGTPVAFQRDRRRDLIFVAAGYRAARVTWDQMHHELDAVVTRIRRTLELAAARSSARP